MLSLIENQSVHHHHFLQYIILEELNDTSGFVIETFYLYLGKFLILPIINHVIISI